MPLVFYFFSACFDILHSIVALEGIKPELTDDVYFKINVSISPTNFAKPRSATK